MKRAFLLIAVSSLLILSSVEATQPVISPTKQQTKSDVVAIINNNLDKIKLNAEQAVAAFDKINNDGFAKTEADVVWLTVCRFDYKTLISHVTNYGKPDLEQGSASLLSIALDTILKKLESCESSFEELAGDRQNPVKIYENSIRDLTQEAINIHGMIN